jgi:hypothetical protein
LEPDQPDVNGDVWPVARPADLEPVSRPPQNFMEPHGWIAGIARCNLQWNGIPSFLQDPGVLVELGNGEAGGFLSFAIAVLKTIFLYQQGPIVRFSFGSEDMHQRVLMVR